MTSYLKWRICIHSTSNADHHIYVLFKNNWRVLQLVFVVIILDSLRLRVCSQGSEAERGRAVFPKHSTDAGVVWSGAARCHGIVVASIKCTVSCSSLTSSWSFLCVTLLSFPAFLCQDTNNAPLMVGLASSGVAIFCNMICSSFFPWWVMIALIRSLVSVFSKSATNYILPVQGEHHQDFI